MGDWSDAPWLQATTAMMTVSVAASTNTAAGDLTTFTAKKPSYLGRAVPLEPGVAQLEPGVDRACFSAPFSAFQRLAAPFSAFQRLSAPFSGRKLNCDESLSKCAPVHLGDVYDESTHPSGATLETQSMQLGAAPGACQVGSTGSTAAG